MTPDEMQDSLAPYLARTLAPTLLQQLSAYLELLLKWNERTNLTAIRDPREIVRRHFGESLAVAEHIEAKLPAAQSAFDLGSGAGFPGLPIALRCPALHVTLIESQGKKATFLREVVRTLQPGNVTIFAARAESLDRQADVLTMRAVDRSGEMLSVAHRLLVPRGTLLLMLGSGQSLNVSDWMEQKECELRGGVRLLHLTK